jgi:glycosidase
MGWAAEPGSATAPAHARWSRQATIYEVNIRQYTPEGTFKAFAQHLPRLARMGVGILWLMPIHPIGQRNRKGTLGSYYSVADYTGVNPAFGTLEDLRALVRQAHALGMKVILDWVANHTAWDHPWTRAHKDWYKLDAKGEIYPVTFQAGTPHEEQWGDVVALDYAKPALRTAMIEAMSYWLREADIDGFRCDVAFLVPTDFWVGARAALDAIKPVFMLAEADKPELHAAFDMSYGWDTAEIMKNIARGKASAQALRDWARAPPAFPADAYRMRFTNNHDFNSWQGSDAELYGAAFPAMAMLSFTLPGMPLIYGGQEAGLARKLPFFEKDAIEWGSFKLERFYAELIALKKRNPALAAGQQGGTLALRDAGAPELFAFTRRLGAHGVDVTVNLSAAAHGSLGPWQWTIQET